MKADCTPIRDGVAKEGALSASEIAAIALKPDEAKLAQEKQDTLDPVSYTHLDVYKRQKYHHQAYSGYDS